MQNKPVPHFAFLKDFPKAKKQAVYAIVGTDSYHSEIVMKTIASRFQTQDASEFDFISLHSDSESVSAILDHLETMPFLAKYKIVIVKEFEQFTAKQIEPLKTYLDSPSPTSILILLAEKLDMRTSFFKSIIKNGVVIDCKPPYNANDMARWLRMELAARNIKMDNEGQQFFANSIEMDYRIAAMELEKIFLYTKNAPFVRQSQVEKCIGISRKNKIFDLQNAIGAKNKKKALQVIENLIANEDASKIGVFTVIMLTRFFTTIWKINACRKNNLTDKEIESTHLPEVFYTFRKDYLRFANNFGENALRNAFGLLLQADTDLKSLNVRSEILLQILIYKLAGMAENE